MKVARRLAASRYLLTALVLFVGYLSVAPIRAQAQCNSGSGRKGFNGVYGKCGGGSTATLQGSFTLVDASMYSSSGDICAAIKAILGASATLNPNGIIVDARGFGAGTPQNCSDNPWNVSALPAASVVLLPSGTITISTTWAMPSNARLIGEGPGITILRASSSFSAADMIDMGNSSICSGGDCPGISIEHLGLDGNSANVSVNGIVNGFSQELGYVNDVAFASIANVGLEVTTKYAADSGPYSNLKMSSVGTCVKLLTGGSTVPLYDTRGIHGLTCTSFSTSAGIYLDSPSNSLEDIYISGTTTQDGILIGDSAPAESNVLFNIYGSGLKNVIHISNHTNSSFTNCPAWASGTIYNVCDLTIMGVTNSGGTHSIADDLTGPSLSDSNVGMYIVGEPVQEGSANTSIGNSRFTSSLSVPTWLVGTASPSGISCATGDLYSRTSGGTTTIYGCAGGGWTAIK